MHAPALALLAVMSIVATAAVRGADYDAAVSAANKRDYVAAAQEFQRQITHHNHLI